MSRVRVLVVDDSAFARKVLREVLAEDPEIEVLDHARDGLEGLEKIEALRPDVITLDLVMPNLDGIGLLRALRGAGAARPRVVVVSVSDGATELGLAALEEGAFDLVQKPTALATDRLYELGRELRAKVRAAGVAPPPPILAPAVASSLPVSSVSTKLLVIGASTGGPPAITRILTALPAELPCAVAVVVHLPPEYTLAFARRLDTISPLRVREAQDGMVVAPGEVLVGRGGVHLRLERRGETLVARLTAEPTTSPHRPSVDVLLSSAGEAVGRGALGVVLTGMGDDGLAGARVLKAKGGRMLTESEQSCVVYGMPRVVKEAGLSDGEASIEEMAALIVSRL